MNQLFLLLSKEYRYELRSLQTVISFVTLSLLLSVITALSLSGSFLSPEARLKIFSSLVWLVFLFASTLSVGRVLDPETRDGAIEGVLLTGVPLWKVFVAKTVVLWSILVPSHLLSVVVLGGFLGVPLFPVIDGVFALTALVSLGYSSLALVLAGLSSTSRLKGLLLAILILPLLAPMLLAAVETSSVLFIDKRPIYGELWFSFLLIIDIVYFLCGINLFEHVVRE